MKQTTKLLLFLGIFILIIGSVSAGFDVTGTSTITSGDLDVDGDLDSNTLNTGHGDNELYAMNQDVESTDAVTFLTIDTGQGANELYDMDQNVLTSSDVIFNSVTASLTGNAVTATALASNPTDCSAGEAPQTIDANGNFGSCTAYYQPSTDSYLLNTGDTATGTYSFDGDFTIADGNDFNVGNSNIYMRWIDSSGILQFTNSPLNKAYISAVSGDIYTAGAIEGATLTVNGNSLLAGNLNVTGSISGNADTATALAANPTDCSAGEAPQTIDASGNFGGCTAYYQTSTDSYLLNTGDTATGDYNFDSNTFVIDSTSNVISIGKLNSQGEPLEINGRIGMFNPSDSTETIKIQYQDSSDMGRIHSYDAGVGYKSTLIEADGNGNQFVVSNNGNVGIKETSPSDTLDVKGQITMGDTGSSSTKRLLIQNSEGNVQISANDGKSYFGPGTATSAITIGTNGYTGVNETSPSELFETSGGNIQVHGTNYGFKMENDASSEVFKLTTDGTNTRIDLNDGSRDLIFDPNSRGSGIGIKTTPLNEFQINDGVNDVYYSDGGWSTGGDFDVNDKILKLSWHGYNNGTTRNRDTAIYDGRENLIAYFDGSSDYVGIGTDYPKSTLDVKGTANGIISVTGASSSNDASLFFYQDTNFVGLVGYDDSESGIRFNNATGTTMILKDSGSLGIGTTSPSDTLDVKGQITMGDTGSSSTKRLFIQNSEGNVQISANDGNAYFGTGGVTSAITVDSSGNVGIDQTSPNAKLDVNGKITSLNVSSNVINIGDGTIPNDILSDCNSGVLEYKGSYMTVTNPGSVGLCNMTSISGGQIGDLLVLRTSDSAQDVKLGDTSGINLMMSGDFTLDRNEDSITFIKHSSTAWMELSRSNNR